MSEKIPHKPLGKERKKMWAYMQSVKRFSHGSVSSATGVSDFKRQNYIAHLKSGGHIKEVGWEDGKKFFTTHDDVELSEMTADRRRTLDGKMWTAIRSLREFTPEDVSAVLIADEPQATPDRVKKYIRVLMLGRYLSVMGPARPRVHSARYRLAKNTGPLPPLMMKKMVIVDTNRECVVHVEGVTL